MSQACRDECQESTRRRRRNKITASTTTEKKKNVQSDTKIIEKGKEQLYLTFSCPSWQLLWKNGCVHQFWYLYPLVSNFHDIWNHLLHELHRSHRNHGVRTRLSLLGYLFAWHYRGDFYKSTDAALIDICGKHWIWTLTLIKEFFPQGKTNKCEDEPELTDRVFWHQMLCQMVSPSSLSSSTLLLHSWVLLGRVQTCSSFLHPSAARLIGFSSSVSSRRDALLWWGEVSETGCLCCEGDTHSFPSASFGVLLHLVTGGLLHICFSTLTHSQPGLWPCCLCVCFGGGLGCHSHLPSPLSGVAGLNSWSDNSPLRPICFQSECLPWSLNQHSLHHHCEEQTLSEPRRSPTSQSRGRIYEGCVHTDDTQTRLFVLKVQKSRTRTTATSNFQHWRLKRCSSSFKPLPSSVNDLITVIKRI